MLAETRHNSASSWQSLKSRGFVVGQAVLLARFGMCISPACALSNLLGQTLKGVVWYHLKLGPRALLKKEFVLVENY
jgi:hypothetical protein